MKTFIKILIFLTVICFNGCFNMYNEADEDMGSEYKYFLAMSHNWANAQIMIYSLGHSGNISNQIWTSVTSSDNREPYYIAAHPTGDYLYVLYQSVNWVGVYRINNVGSLSFIESKGANVPYDVKVHPTGKYLYYSNNGNDTISMYQVNGDGTLTELVGSPTSSHGSNPTRLAIAPSGNYLFAAESNSIAAFQINNDGTLTHETTQSTAQTSGITDIIVDNNGHIYFTSNGGIFLYTRPSTFQNQSLNGNNGYLAVHPSGNYLYIANTTTYYSFQITANGSLNSLNSGGTVSDVKNIVVHPSGNYLYSANRGGGRIDSFIINADGSIQSTVYQTISGGWPFGLAIIRKKIK